MTKTRKILITIAAATLSASMVAFAACAGENGPEVNAGQGGNSSVTVTDKQPEQLTAYEVAYAYLDKESNLTSYELHSTGETVASLLGYTQYVNDVGFKFGDEYYKQNVSTSTFANVNHEAFAKKVNGVSKVAYRNDGGEISVADREGNGSYKSVYGVSPDDVALGGYIINSSTLLKAERLSGENRYQLKPQYANDLQYHFQIATTDEATVYNKLQMVKYGGLSAAPEFTAIDLYLTIASDWTPRELISHAEYSAQKSMVFNMSFTCTQDITATYTNVNALTQNPIPDTAEFNYALGSQPSTQVSPEDVTTPPSEVTGALLDVVQDVVPFGERIKNTGMHFGVDFALPILINPISIDTLFGPLEYNLIKAPATAEIFVKYNADAVEANDYLNAVNLYGEVDLSGFMKGGTILGSMLMPMLPTIVGDAAGELDPEVMNLVVDLSQVTALKVYYLGTGNLYVTLINKSDVVYHVISVTANDLLPLVPVIGDLATDGKIEVDDGQTEGEGSIDINTALTDVVEFFEDNFTVEVVETDTGTDTVLSLVPETVEKVNEWYAELVANLDLTVSDYISQALGSMGNLIPISIKSIMGADIYAGELHFVREITQDNTELKDIYFQFLGYTEKDYESVDDSGVPLTSTTVLRVGITNDGDLYNELMGKDEEVAAFVADEKVASILRNEIDWLEQNMWLDGDNTFIASVNALKKQYQRLTPSQQALVSNSAKIGISGGYKYDDMALTYGNLKNSADEFLANFDESGAFIAPADANAWIELNKLYDEKQFNAAQVEYITQAKIDAYLAAREQWKTEFVEGVQTRLNAVKQTYFIDGEVKTDLTAEQVIALVKSMVNGADQNNGQYSLEYLVSQVADVIPAETIEDYELTSAKALEYALTYLEDKMTYAYNYISGMIESGADPATADLGGMLKLEPANVKLLYSNLVNLNSISADQSGNALKWYCVIEGGTERGAAVVEKLNYCNEQLQSSYGSTQFSKALKEAFNAQYGAIKDELLKGLTVGKTGGIIPRPTYSLNEEYLNGLDAAAQQKLLQDVNYWYDLWQAVNEIQPLGLGKISNAELDNFHTLLNEWMASKS